MENDHSKNLDTFIEQSSEIKETNNIVSLADFLRKKRGEVGAEIKETLNDATKTKSLDSNNESDNEIIDLGTEMTMPEFEELFSSIELTSMQKELFKDNRFYALESEAQKITNIIISKKINGVNLTHEQKDFLYKKRRVLKDTATEVDFNLRFKKFNLNDLSPSQVVYVQEGKTDSLKDEIKVVQRIINSPHEIKDRDNLCKALTSLELGLEKIERENTRLRAMIWQKMADKKDFNLNDLNNVQQAYFKNLDIENLKDEQFHVQKILDGYLTCKIADSARTELLKSLKSLNILVNAMEAVS